MTGSPAAAPRERLDRDAAVELIRRLEKLCDARPTLLDQLRRLRSFMSAQPDGATEFPLLDAAQTVSPGAADEVAAFRELRRTMTEFAAQRGVDVALEVDGQKRAEPSARMWWMESTDATNEKLTDLADASTAAVTAEPVVPAFGRSERDGKTVVRTYFDFAPGDAPAVERCVAALSTRLATDREYLFDRVPPADLGAAVDEHRGRALASADLVVAFLSPEYLRWSTEPDRAVGSALAVARGRVAPVCWSRLTDRSDLGPYASAVAFTPRVKGTRHPFPTTDNAGLDHLRAPQMDNELADLHSMLAKLLASARIDPMEVLARHLAANDEPNPVTLRFVQTMLDKGVDALTAPSGSAVDVVDHLVRWATTGDRHYFVVFGEYGMGKTVATQTLTRRLMSLREADPAVPLPIYFDLRLLSTELRKQEATLSELLADLIERAWLTGEAKPSVTPTDVITAVQRRGAVIVFDGLDEVLVHLTEQQGQAMLRELLRVLPPQLATQTATQRDAGRVVLTCRTHFFRTLRDQHNLFRSQDRDGIGADLYKTLHLLPFDDHQVRAYLERKHGTSGVDRAVELIRSVHDLGGLATRPYNLSLISGQLERLERRIADGRPVDAAGLYEELVQSWLERDMGKHQFERDHKVRLMEDLAALLWAQGTRQIAVGELEKWLRRRLLDDDDLGNWVQLKRPDPAVLAEDLRTATFIVRPGADQFEFAHTSLLEYFLARYLHRTMSEDRPAGWGLPAVSDETLDFLVEIADSDAADDFDHHLVACGVAYQPRVSEHVVRYALRSAWSRGRVPSLRGFQLRGADLRGIRAGPSGAAVDLSCSVLIEADLRDAVLHQVRLDDANLTGALLTRAELHRCSLRCAVLDRADLAGSVLRATQLDGANFQGADTDDSQWLWCVGEPRERAVTRGLIGPPVAPVSPGPDVRLEVLAGPSGPISSLAWSPDGSRLAGGARDAVEIWNPASGAHLARLTGPTDLVLALAWSPDGARLASGGDDGTVRLWDPDRPDNDPCQPSISSRAERGAPWGPTYGPPVRRGGLALVEMAPS